MLNLGHGQYPPVQPQTQYVTPPAVQKPPTKPMEAQKYVTPEMQFVDTTAILQKILEQRQLARQPAEVYFPEGKWYFDEPVVVDGETIQVIRKALPKSLTRFGSQVFQNIPQISASQLPVAGEYIIGTGDKLLLNIWGAINSQYELVVDRDGKIYIPQAGEVAVAGLSINAARKRVGKALKRVFADINYSLTLAAVKTIQVFVVGHVKNPGIYDLPGLSRVVNAVAAAGGPSRSGSYRKIKVYRRNKLVAKLDLYDLFTEGKAKGNIQLASGDVVVVPGYEKLVKLRGKVKTPAVFELIEGETISDLLKYSGGVTADADVSNIFVDRIENGQHIAVTLDLTDSLSAKTEILDGDDISIFPVNPYREDVVFVAGYIPHSGAYGWHEGLTLGELLGKEGMLFADTYKKRVDILRLKPDGRREIIAADLISEKANTPLKPQDKIILYSVRDFLYPRKVAIFGSVKNPGVYELYDGMRVSDLVFHAGGLLVEAYLDSVELVRIVDGIRRESMWINLSEVLNNPGSAQDVLLRENDVVVVHSIPGWLKPEIVTILGEVKYPGNYAIIRENETLSELFQRCGGFTEDAFLEGVTMIRPKISERVGKKNLQAIISSTRPIIIDSLGRIDTLSYIFSFNPEDLNRMIISAKDVIRGKTDIVLEAGDTIIVPKIPGEVSVIGAVALNGTVKFKKGKNARYYIKMAGGLTKNADADQIRLVKMNGRVEKISLGYDKISPGDVIIVPKKIERKVDVLAITSTIVSIISGAVTSLYIILRLK